MATMPYGTKQTFIRCSTLGGKNNIFVSGYSTTGVHGTKKTFGRTLTKPKKYIYFRFCLQYYCMGLIRLGDLLKSD